ncbi:hypothetical protein [Kitasatospora sp. NBC_01302]|uniref:hypothetical protein n=1 Tax=Kitasatospora sp. NBC_01302 TaxID=2903575 RepID=UPI002E0DD07A|nr:hypothetical protein OG294_14015 [Kitasatospora sp. NBC_01302]
MARKSKPWAVICATPGQPIRTEHTSEKKAFEKVRAEADLVQQGRSRVTRIRVEKWATDHWQLFDLIDPKEW